MHYFLHVINLFSLIVVMITFSRTLFVITESVRFLAI